MLGLKYYKLNILINNDWQFRLFRDLSGVYKYIRSKEEIEHAELTFKIELIDHTKLN